MFGLSWGEIGLIMAAALIFIGPKDLPVAIRTVTSMIRKARGMASEFQGHVDEMMRDANLADVKTEINKLRSFDFTGAAEQAIDPDGKLREAVAAADPDGKLREAVAAAESGGSVYKPPVPVEEELPDYPAFIPPEAVRKKPMPAFLPPGTKRWGW